MRVSAALFGGGHTQGKPPPPRVRSHLRDPLTEIKPGDHQTGGPQTQAGAAARMGRKYHKLSVGRESFEIDTRSVVVRAFCNNLNFPSVDMCRIQRKNSAYDIHMYVLTTSSCHVIAARALTTCPSSVTYPPLGTRISSLLATGVMGLCAPLRIL